MTGGRLLGSAVVLASLFAAAPARAALWSGEPGAWTVSGSDGVVARLEREPAGDVRLDFDFAGHGGWAVLRQPLVLPRLPENYELRLRVRGAGAVNDLEVKLVDGRGENVWWWTRRGQPLPVAPTELRLRKRQLSFAWGPLGGGEPLDLAALEIAVVAGSGGRGSLSIAGAELVERPPEPTGPLTPTASASASAANAPAALAVDGDAATAWRGGAGAAFPVVFDLDLGAEREFGGLTLDWDGADFATDYDVELSEDGRAWNRARSVRGAAGGRARLALPESSARYVRLRLLRSASVNGPALREARLETLEFAASPNAFVGNLARDAPRGSYPRGFLEQAYWTVVGVDGGVEKGLLSEDGALEASTGAPAVEPFLEVDGHLLTWADAELTPALFEGALPMPSVTWRARGVALEVSTFADGPPEKPFLLARYGLRSLDGKRHRVTLALALRPFQVDPPSQFLNGAGGVAEIRRLELAAGWVRADGRNVARAITPGFSWSAATFDAGGIVEALKRRPSGAGTTSVEDASGLASGALSWRFDLRGEEQRQVVLLLPSVAGAGARLASADGADGALLFSERWAAVAAGWRQALGRFELSLPDGAPPLAAVARTALAHVLMLREGAALQPGARSYRRAWIRDGALMSEALLRLGQGGAARDFLDWYAGFLFADGKVPCCVDRRGGDPVAENDAPGEFLHLVSDVWRYGGDRAFLDALWPRVQRTVAFIDTLRQQRRTPEFQSAERRAFYGLLPESISHEGYSAKPMHSFWDDFWALRGLEDAVTLAAARGDQAEALRWSALRDEFAGDLYAALRGTMARHGMDVLPGCVELGDFDPTSSTIALAPGGQQSRLPQAELRQTFARYFASAERRWQGGEAWEAYTPYEWRTVGSLVRLGEREQALQVTSWLLGDRRPAAWNQWPEVVRRDTRQVGFLGDLPHGWVAADFLRSALDIFAYEREDDSALVLAAGVAPEWLAAGGIAVRNLRTPYGPLSYRLARRGDELEYRIDGMDGDLRLPAGGLVLAGPLAGRMQSVTVDGETVPLPQGEVRVHRLPARVVIAIVAVTSPR